MISSFDPSVIHRFDLASQYEWLETNGLGGYASSTIIGTLTRRYHGLLIAPRHAPVGRQVLLSKMDEAVWVHDRRYDLACNKYQGGIFPSGYIFQQAFHKGLFPEFVYQTNGIRLKKTVAMVHGENTTLLLYEVLAANADFTLELLPLTAARDHHCLTQAHHHLKQYGYFSQDTLRCQFLPELPELMIKVPNAHFESQPDWYFSFEYAQERARGMPSSEDLFTPGKFYVQLKEGDKLGIIISTEACEERDAFALFAKEKARRLSLVKEVGEQSPILSSLALAGDQFLVKRENHKSSIIAGYPWFSDWGRDTMIALPGLCLATGRHEEAQDILSTFIDHIDQGMLPNRFPDDGSEAEYNTIDATLWLFVAAYKYYKASRDLSFIEETVLPALENILQHHKQGTRYGIRMTEDQLLTGGEEGLALTWMDAKAGDWVVTPRRGKCVEINALWYNAWEICAYFSKKIQDPQRTAHYAVQAKRIRKAFKEVFWYEEEGYLFDRVEGEEKDPALRPNQIFALSLPFPLFTGQKASQILEAVEEELLTPFGLRTLAPSDPAYIGLYQGDVHHRDGAYHQGTVWPWLLGPFMDAMIRVQGGLGQEKARRMIETLMGHYGKSGVGSLSEIFDGDAPYHPRGCFAQAWSVSELLRVADEHRLFERMPKASATSTRRSRRGNRVGVKVK
ncbi:MAG: amylo-alpha-1,6-glucosidase [Bacteroidota bacterium]